MGFCRRCGDIVAGARCKCGGSAVAPVLQWSSSKCQAVDRWSRTYISRDALEEPASRIPRPSVSTHLPSPCFDVEEHDTAQPRVLQTSNAPELSNAYGSVLQPKDTLATYSCAICLTEFQPDATIFPDPCASGLSDRFLCRPCFITHGGSKGDCPTCRRPVLILKSEGGFVEASGRVWHKKCFRCDGCHKSIGDTPMVDVLGQPSCADCFDSCLRRNSTPKKSHPVLGLEKADNRIPNSREGSPAIDELEQRLGILKTREGSPVLEELTQRLNAVLSRASPSMSPPVSHLNRDDRESSPFSNRILQKKRSTTFNHGADPVDTLSPDVVPESVDETKTSAHDDRVSFSARPSLDAIEEMKNRIMNQITSSPVPSSNSSPRLRSRSPLTSSPVSFPSLIPRMSRISGSPRLRHATSTSSLHTSRASWTPSTPDLVPDVSDTLTQSSGPSSPPPTFSPQVHPRDDFASNLTEHIPPKDVATERSDSGIMTPKPKDPLGKSSIPTATLSSGSLCAKCGGSLFATGGSGRFVTVPELGGNGPPKTYHTECFRCVLCDGPFRETTNGQAIFVRGEGGACHLECAPPDKTQTKASDSPSTRKYALTDPPPIAPSRGPSYQSNGLYSSSRYERPSSCTSASLSTSGRFGSSVTCPGCQKAVSPMELGVVPGPQGSRWHFGCLVCGGKGSGKGRRDKSQPGCGKRLDSGAKRDAHGGVWCRECLLLLPPDMRSAQIESPIKPLVPSYTGRGTGTGSGASIGAQLTGTTTIARQFTGRGGGDILRQLTGGGLSPTRQLAGSPTKQMGVGTPRARPKSVIGIRGSKSSDEGRGMYLVRQMTGGGVKV